MIRSPARGQAAPSRRRLSAIVAGLGALAGAVAVASADDAPSPLPPERLAFFETKIRPVLVQHCQSCHAAGLKSIKGGLRVDSREGLLAGGDSGPPIVPGKPAESPLLDALKYDGIQMPPKGKLPDAVIADFETWIRTGAHDPRTTPAGKSGPQVGMSIAEGRTYWAYRPVSDPPVPKAPNPGDTSLSLGSATEMDRFILARLVEAKVTPAAEADRTTLIRRLTFDLHGLPPTPEEIDAFLADRSPDAWPKLVDRLLASPRFGERWGRHWLDIARFGESLTLRGFVIPSAWRYRDYVIESFRSDRPLNEFIREQLAGDLMPSTDPAVRERRLIATSYLTIGNINLEEQDKKLLRMDAVDEQLDAIGKGLLGQTVTCARCHDHKFDPIPTRDYYALAGILRNTRMMEHANVSNWIKVPLPASPSEEAVFVERERRMGSLTSRIAEMKKTLASRKPAGPPIIPVTALVGAVVDDAQAKKVGDWVGSTHSGRFIGAGYLHDGNADKGAKSLTFEAEGLAPGRYEVRLAYSPGGSRASAVPVTVFSAAGERELKIDMTKAPPVEGRFVSLGEYRFEKSGFSHVLIETVGTSGHVTADAVQFLPLEPVAATVAGGSSPNRTPPGTSVASVRGDRIIAGLAPNPADAELKRMESELAELKRQPARPSVVGVTEEKAIEDSPIHIRGLPGNLGPVVPRGFLSVVDLGPGPTFPRNASGRKELADWITDPRHPLTSRVYVNRVWHWLTGAGLVRSVDNFGVTGEKPTHPELLDHLASRFIREGWSTKKLVRAIVLSQAYRRSSAVDAKLLERDPENRLLARATSRRLDGESIRDAMLAAAGQLDLNAAGRTYPETLEADYGFKADRPIRSVYLPAFRNSPPEPLALFDPPDSSMVTGRREESTVAPQALYFLNHPFPEAQARLLADRLRSENHPNDRNRIDRLWRLTLGHPPSDAERAIATAFLARAPATSPAGWNAGDTGVSPKPDTRVDRWADLARALYASADFRRLD